MMILDSLVKNYYERKGNFDGICGTCVGTALQKIQQETGWDMEDICYFMLGYAPLDQKRCAQVASDRIRYGQGDTTVAEEYGCNSMKELGKKFKMSKFPKQKKQQNEYNHEDLVRLLSEFYRSSPSNLIQLPDGIFTVFSAWLMKQCVTAESIVGQPYVKPCLVKFQYSNGVDPTIYGRTLFVNRKLSEKEQLEINKRAIERAAMLKDIFHKWSKMPVMDVILMGQNVSAKYLELLDLCRSVGMTYAEAVLRFGVKIPDLFTAYDYMGFIFMAFENGYLVQDEGMPVWYSVDRGTFLDMVEKAKPGGDFSENKYIGQIKGTGGRRMSSFSPEGE